MLAYPTVIGMKTPELLKNFASDSLPTLYVIDRQGTICLTERGFDTGSKLSNAEELLQTLLNEQRFWI